MRGHIRERKPGTWAIVIELPRGADGKRQPKWHTIQGTRRDAERECTRLLHELQTDSYAAPTRLTVAEFLQRWLADCKRHTVSPASFDRYESVVRVHLIPALGRLLLTRLTPLQIQRYYADAATAGRSDGQGGLAPRSVAFHHVTLKQALQQAVRWQMLPRNPAAAVDPPRVQDQEMIALTRQQMGSLLRLAQPTRYYLPIFLALATGMRRNELLALRWQDVDLDAGRLAVRRSLEKSRQGIRFKEPKTRRGRRPIELPFLVVETLRQHRDAQRAEKLLMGDAYQDQDLILARSDGTPHTPAVISHGYAELARRLQLPSTRFHDLRHTHATLLLNQGENPKIVSERLGHSGVGITLDRYSHLLPDLQEQAARRLDESLRAALS